MLFNPPKDCPARFILKQELLSAELIETCNVRRLAITITVGPRIISLGAVRRLVSHSRRSRPLPQQQRRVANLACGSALRSKKIGNREWNNHLSIMFVVCDDHLPRICIVTTDMKQYLLNEFS
jgi:hypothetical protein